MASVLAGGCTGFQSFPLMARSGDTISLTLGWNPELSRDQLEVTITPSSGPAIVYYPGDPAVRALVNMYPDPLSRLIVERETGTFADDGYLFSALMESSVTGPDKDFSQKILLLDLPEGIATGPATISFNSIGGKILPPLTVEIVPGLGTKHLFQVQESLQPTLAGQLDLAERSPHYVISFGGTTVPHAIQVDLTHDPSQSDGGIGKPYVISARGDVKTVLWSDDGTRLRVILIPTHETLTDFTNFRFYVVGGIQNLQATLGGVRAFDINGAELTGADIVSAAVDAKL